MSFAFGEPHPYSRSSVAATPNNPEFSFVTADDDEFSFIWKIKNFTYCVEGDGEYIHSPPFTFNSVQGGNFSIKLSPRARTECLEVHPLSYPNLVFSYGILCGGELENPSVHEKNTNQKMYWMKLDEIPRSELFGRKKRFFLPHDTLTLRVMILHTDGRLLKHPRFTYARTVIGIESTSLHWAIKEFSALRPLQKKSYSLKFLLKHPEMKIILFLNYIFRNEESVQVEEEFTNANKLLMICKISLLDSEGNVTKSLEQEKIFEADGTAKTWSFPALISKRSLMADKERYLPNDVLTLRFEFVTSIGIASNTFEEEDVTCTSSIEHANENNHNQRVNHDRKVSNNVRSLHSLYERNEFCDATLQAKDRAFPVHRAFSVHKSVICAMSPVFFAMFKGDMVENKSGIVFIPDLDADTLERMVLYMYTENVPELHWDSASRLYYAADKYRIQSLKEECSVFLKAHMSVQNVYDVLVLADRHRDIDLKLAAQQFIANADKEIFNSDEFKAFERNNLEVAVETWREIHLKKV